MSRLGIGEFGMLYKKCQPEIRGGIDIKIYRGPYAGALRRVLGNFSARELT
jgi:hypothetical protein